MLSNVFDKPCFGLLQNDPSNQKKNIEAHQFVRAFTLGVFSPYDLCHIFYETALYEIPRRRMINNIIDDLVLRMFESGDDNFFEFLLNSTKKVGMFSQNAMTNPTFVGTSDISLPTAHPVDVLNWIFFGTEYWFSFFYPHNIKVLLDSLGRIAAEFKKLFFYWNSPHGDVTDTKRTVHDAFFGIRFSTFYYAIKFDELYRKFSMWIFQHFMYRHTHGFYYFDINYEAIFDKFLRMFCDTVLRTHEEKALDAFIDGNEKIYRFVSGQKEIITSRPSFRRISGIENRIVTEEQRSRSQHQFAFMMERFGYFLRSICVPAHERAAYQRHIERDHAATADHYRATYGRHPDFLKVFRDLPFVMKKTDEQLGCLKHIAITDQNLFNDVRNGSAPKPDFLFCVFGNALRFDH
jgi:hypothetical protein